MYHDFSRKEILQIAQAPLSTVLDVGCGTGNFLNLLKKSYGCETWGVEPSKTCSLRQNKSIDYPLVGTWEDALNSLPPNYFDAIFFNDVLEHMIDPSSCLEQAARLLSARGKVYASIPNFIFADNLAEIIVSKDWQYQDSGILDWTHLRFFTRKSMIRLFADAGYCVEKIVPLSQVKTWKWKLLLALSFNKLLEFSVYQYGVVAAPKQQ